MEIKQTSGIDNNNDMAIQSKKQSKVTGQLVKSPVNKKTGKSLTVANKPTQRPTNTGRWVSVKTPAPQPTEQVHVDKAGRIVVPARFRRVLGIEPGDPVTVTLEDDVLRIRTIQTSLERARTLMRKKNPTKRSLTDELIAERRAEAAKE